MKHHIKLQSRESGVFRLAGQALGLDLLNYKKKTAEKALVMSSDENRVDSCLIPATCE